MMGDRSKLLTHYHDDAKTMYEVFQRGLHISGGYEVRWENKPLVASIRVHTYTRRHVRELLPASSTSSPLVFILLDFRPKKYTFDETGKFLSLGDPNKQSFRLHS